MKRLLFIMLAAMQMFAASYAGTAKDGEYLIKGTVENGAGNTTLYLYELGGGLSFTCTDSATVKNGKFEFRNTISTAIAERILSTQKDITYRVTNICHLYIEPTEMTLVVKNLDVLKDSKLTGSMTQAEVDDYNAAIKETYQPLMELNDQYYKVRDKGDTIALAEIRAKMTELGKVYQAASKAWMDAHPDAYVTFNEKSRGLSDMTLQQVDSLFRSFPARLKGTSPYNSVETELKNLKKSAPGVIASDFTSTDINGKQFTLSSLRGHYVILDFWASWCVPCRKSMPHVKALYAKYKDKGLKVVCVASDDGAEAKWRKAVADDATEMFHHVLSGLKQKADGSYDKSNDIGENYAVHYLPTKFLIDPEGKIVDKMDDEGLDAKLKEIFE